MGFGQGLSGLNAASQNLDVIGNNIANSGTVGFKSGTASFADVYASSRIGLGVQVSTINQRFGAGNVNITGNQYDMAVDGGSGFFRLLNSSGETVYSRNGEFQKDKDQFIVNAQGQQLTGYPVVVDATTGARTIAVGADPVALQVPVGNIAPLATTNVIGSVNLDSGSPVIAAAFNPSDPDTFSRSTVSTVFDSLGNAHDLTQYFVKRAAVGGASEWDVYYTLDGQAMAPTTMTPGVPPAADTWGDPTKMVYSNGGVLTHVGPTNVPTVPPTLTIPLTFAGLTTDPVSPAEALNVAVNYGGSTSFGNPFNFKGIPNGYAGGEFASIGVGVDGTIQASYTNGQSQAIGMVVLANFNNVQGLQPIGGNAWTESPSSGQAILGQPGTNGLSKLKGQAVEASNVDMSQELVNMIIAQRTYQANAQTIKTQDQIMQTLISMR